MDLDAVMIKELPNTDKGWFSTMPAKMTGGFAPKWGDAHPPITIHDNSWNGKALIAFPIKVNDIMKLYIEKLSFKIMKTLALPPATNSNAWNYVIWALKDIVKVDTELLVYESMYMHPLPSWLNSGKCYSLESPTRLNGKTELFGHNLPSIEDILQKSYFIHHFFESAFNKSSKVQDDFWLTVKDGSLVNVEAEYVLGNQWRQELNEYAN
jgi:hypothetical protein